MRLLGTDFCVLSLRSPAELLAHTCLVIESCSSLCNTWTVAYQAPLSIEFFRQEYWSGLPFPSPEDLPNPRSEPSSLVSPALKVGSLPTEPLGKPTRYLEPLVAQRVKRLPAMRETWVQSLSREDPPEKEMAIHFSIIAWKIPWMQEPGGLQSIGSQRVKHDWATFFFHQVPNLGQGEPERPHLLSFGRTTLY